MNDEYQKALSSIENINAVKTKLKKQLEEIMIAIEAAQKKSFSGCKIHICQ